MRGVIRVLKKIARSLIGALALICLLTRYRKSRKDRFDFVILSTYRSGSTYLADALNSHPDIICHDELFHIGYCSCSEKWSGWLPIGKISQKARIFFFKRFSDYLLCFQEPDELAGFKMIVSTADDVRNQFKGKLKQYILHDTQLKKIILVRRNSVRRFISVKIAKKTRKWHTKEQQSERTKIYFDVDEFMTFEKKIRRDFADLLKRLRKQKHLFIVLCYEDIFSDKKDEELERAQKFLGIQTCALHSGYRKMNPFLLHEMISNIDEVRDRLQKTRYSPYVADTV